MDEIDRRIIQALRGDGRISNADLAAAVGLSASACHRRVRLLDQPAIDVPDAELDATLGAGYGIFAGREVQWARLRFSADRARWIAAETWHPQQRGHWDDAGRWLLELPYADPRELVMDILRHVPEVEVLAPVSLREEVVARMRVALARLTP